MTASTRFTGDDDAAETDPRELLPSDEPERNPEDYSPGPHVDMTKEAAEGDILEQQIDVPGMVEDPEVSEDDEE